MEKIDKAIEILQAFKEGRCIETKDYYSDKWYVSCGDIPQIIDSLFNTRYAEFRIKPHPTYRHYANAEEFLKASKKHSGWFRKCNNKELLFTPYYIDNIAGAIYFRNNKLDCWAHYKDLCNDYVWADDNTPCGILEQ